MIGPGLLNKMPDFETQEFTKEVYDLEEFATANSLDGSSDPPVGATTALSVYNLPIYTNPFVERTHSGQLNKCHEKLPVVGNLHAGAPLGMDVDQCAFMPDLERGATNDDGLVMSLEPENYWGKPSTLMRMPRVVLIRLTSGHETVVAHLQSLMDTLIERLKIQVIIESVSDANEWNPFAYGCPHAGWTTPGVKDPFIGYEAGELLTIYFTGNGYGPVINNVGAALSATVPLHSGQVTVATPYFVSINGLEIDYLAPDTGGPYPGSSPAPPSSYPGFGHVSVPDTFVNIPGADGLGESSYWTSLSERYWRRSYIMHNTPEGPYQTKYRLVGVGDVEWVLDDGDPAMWEAIDGRELEEVIDEGSSPPGAPSSASYFSMFAASGQILGRTVDGDADIAAAIVEDILSFWSS
jgi:hypothetical protein